MHTSFKAIAAALAFSAASLGHAGTIGFDTPTLIDTDSTPGLALYREAGFSIAGQPAGFLQIDGLGSAMSGALVLLSGETISLTAGNGGMFGFAGLDAGAFDTTVAAMLNVTGIFADSTVLSSSVTLAELGNFSFAGLTGLSELRLSASADVVLDNLMVSASEVPEPGTTAMLLLGVGALVAARRFSKA